LNKGRLIIILYFNIGYVAPERVDGQGVFACGNILLMEVQGKFVELGMEIQDKRICFALGKGLKTN